MNVLVLAPHADDEVLGCGGLIARRAREGDSVDVAIATLGGLGRSGDEAGERRHAELAKATSILGANAPVVLFPGRDGQLDTLPRIDIVSAIDRLLEEKDYDEVYVNYPSHHQDHCAVYAAFLGALRPRGRREPSLVALYEYPYVGWSPVVACAGRFYVDISKDLVTKEKALLAYGSEVREAPHPMSWESVETLARMRGMECGLRHAELFYVLRVIR